MRSWKVLIAGAGIGGLTLAAALRRAGCQVRVFERAPEFRPLGAGITMQANAMLALRDLDTGIGDELVAAGSVPHQSALLDPRGRPLTRTELQPIYQRLGAPVVCIHRARLHEILLRHAGRECLSLGRRVAGFEERGDAVAVRLEGGAVEEGDLLVGADGLGSAVRAQLLADGEAVYAGYTSWRGVCGGVEVPRHFISESWGRGARFGVVPIGEDLVYWFATANAPAGQREAAGERARLRALFAGWHAPVPALIEATRDEQLLRTDISDRPPVRSWSRGRVTLLGDAAHPMTPNLGQGGGQAVEDAVVLARALSEHAEPGPALAAYEDRRVPRANDLVVQSRKLGQMGQWQGAIACAVRDRMMRLAPAGAVTRRILAVMRFQP
jgi:2-polyprenyl-6-methoxyphenol hydroxylase-like FAD-dependent oxidoreductase